MKKVDEKFLKYLPEKYKENIVWLEKCHNECDNSNVYFLIYNINGKEYHADNSDTISELKWNAIEIIKKIESK